MNIKDIEEAGIVKLSIVLNDMIIVSLSFWLAYACVHGVSQAAAFPVNLVVEMGIAVLTILPVSYIAPPVFLKRMVYGNDILARTSYSAFLQLLFMLAVLGLTRRWEIARSEVFIASAFFFVLIFSQRSFVHGFLKKKRARGRNMRNVLLVGHPWNLSNVYHTLADHSLGYNVVGIFTRKELPEDMKIPNLGERRSVMNYLRRHSEITDVYMVPDTDYETETEEIFRYCEDHLIRFYALPVFLDFLTKKMELSHLGNTMLLSVRKEPLQDPANRFVKRAFDLLVSSVFLLTVFPPLYLIVAIVIKMQSPGPVFFVQKRNGLDGKEFNCLKFRSMHVNNDADRVQATENDPRKFRFGDFMRRTNIDEFPQFINVLRGDMSMVGPRPHMLLHTEEYSRLIRRYMVRHLVKPGITGWAQVQGFRGETKRLSQMENRVKADIWYVENWSFALDIRIMCRTVANMIRHDEKNAY